MDELNKNTQYWIQSSDKNFNTMNNLFKSKDYDWALFIGHLVIEKLLKAYYYRQTNHAPPFIHNLLRLAELSGIELNEERIFFFSTVTTFNLNTRYDDYKQNFYKQCTPEFTAYWIEKINEYRTWIKTELV